MRKALVHALLQLAESDASVVLLTADLGFMVLEEFYDAFPDRFFNVGVAEANMVGLATGMASLGFTPYVYSMATFATMRAYEQIRNGPVLHQLPVRIIGVGGGFEYGSGGITHHGLEDIGITRVQPGLRIIVPADPEQARQAIIQTHGLPGPTYFRLSKRDDCHLPELKKAFTLGALDVIRQGSALLFLSLGTITREVVAAAGILDGYGISSSIAVVSSIRPAPRAQLIQLMRKFDQVMTVEDHYVDGGLGSLVCEVAAENRLPCRVTRLGVKTEAAETCGSESYMRRLHGLDVEGITRAALAACDRT